MNIYYFYTALSNFPMLCKFQANIHTLVPLCCCCRFCLGQHRHYLPLLYSMYVHAHNVHTNKQATMYIVHICICSCSCI